MLPWREQQTPHRKTPHTGQELNPGRSFFRVKSANATTAHIFFGSLRWILTPGPQTISLFSEDTPTLYFQWAQFHHLSSKQELFLSSLIPWQEMKTDQRLFAQLFDLRKSGVTVHHFLCVLALNVTFWAHTEKMWYMSFGPYGAYSSPCCTFFEHGH